MNCNKSEKGCSCNNHRCDIPISIFTPANCQKLSVLRYISGNAAPNCELCIKIDDCPAVTCCTNHKGRFKIDNPYELEPGSHKIIVCYSGCDSDRCSGKADTVWVYTDASVCCRPDSRCDADIELLCARTGSSFRTIDVTLRSCGYCGRVDVNYLLVPPYSPAPTAEDILCFDDVCALETGCAAVGSFSFAADQCGTEITYPLTGLEGNDTNCPITGIIDGYNYDVYLAPSTNGCPCSVIFCGTVMAMPFDGVSGDDGCHIYELRELTADEIAMYPDLMPCSPLNTAQVPDTARMLTNLQRLKSLYDCSSGLHGLRDSLSYNYVLTSGFDLNSYGDAYCGSGWLPIGTDISGGKDCGCTDVSWAFSGTLQGSGSDTPITNLKITLDTSEYIENPGLFGSCIGATLDGILIDGADISFVNDGCAESSAIGALSGLFSEGNVRRCCAKNINLMATTESPQELAMSTGGLIGGCSCCCIAECCSEGKIASNGLYTGGLAGFASSRTVIENCYSSVIISSDDACADTRSGGLLGIGTDSVIIKNCLYAGAVTGSYAAGGIAGSIGDFCSITSCLNLAASISTARYHAHRILSMKGGIYAGNYSRADTTLMQNGQQTVAIDDPDGLDGGSVDIEVFDFSVWDTDNIWDTSTIAALGYPTLLSI